MFLPCLGGLIFSLCLSGQNIPHLLIENVFVILSNMSDLCEGGILTAHFVMQLFWEKQEKYWVLAQSINRSYL